MIVHCDDMYSGNDVDVCMVCIKKYVHSFVASSRPEPTSDSSPYNSSRSNTSSGCEAQQGKDGMVLRNSLFESTQVPSHSNACLPLYTISALLI
jgi:hypothetical protein